jgi:Sulfatase
VPGEVESVSGAVEVVDPAPIGAPRFGPWRRELRAFLELLAVTGMTLARPTFGILTNNTAVFVSRHTQPLELVAFTLLLVLLPPFLLWLVEVGVGALLPRARPVVHAVLVAIVAGIFVVAVLKKQTTFESALLIVGGVAAAGVAGWLVWRFEATRLFLRYIAIAPVIFAVLFLTSSAVRSAVFEPDPGVAHVTVTRPHRVVMVILDEFPEVSLLDGHGAIDADLFPNFAALAASSTWYRNATTVAPYTGAAVPAILTGKYRTGDTDAQVASSAPHNVFTLLGGSYSMNVDEAGTRLCPEALCPVDEQETDTGVWNLLTVSRELWWKTASPTRETANALSDADILGFDGALETGERWVKSLQPMRRPRLDLVHVFIPHQPWHYLPTGQDYLEDKPAPGLLWDYTWGSAWSAALGHQRHLLQVAAVDRLLGQVVTRLKRIGAYDDSVLVVTADHGVAFGDRVPIRGVSRGDTSQVLWVPMFVKSPGQAQGKVDDRPARSIDLLPTVADDIGVKLPWPVDGRSLRKPPRRDGMLQVHDWVFNTIKPGRDGYIHVPGPSGFAQVLRTTAVPAGGSPTQRLLTVGPFGGLLGRDAQSLERAGNEDGTATLDDPSRFQSVHLRGRRVPWRYIKGTIHGDVAAGAPLAITVNGIVAGLSGADPPPGAPDKRVFSTVLDPAAFHAGRNVIGVAVIDGLPDAPSLVPLGMKN